MWTLALGNTCWHSSSQLQSEPFLLPFYPALLFMTTEWGHYTFNNLTSVAIYWLKVETMFIFPTSLLSLNSFQDIRDSCFQACMYTLSLWTVFCKLNTNYFFANKGWEMDPHGKTQTVTHCTFRVLSISITCVHNQRWLSERNNSLRLLSTW